MQRVRGIVIELLKDEGFSNHNGSGADIDGLTFFYFSVKFHGSALM